MKTVGSGYIPKNHQTTCSANSKGLFAYYQVRGDQFHPHLPHGRWRRFGLGRDHRRQGSLDDRRGGADANRIRQGAEEQKCEGARARALHGHPRTAREREISVADDRPVQRAGGRKRVRPELFHRQGPGHDESRREGIQRTADAEERRRQSDSATVTDRARRNGGKTGDLGREGRAEESCLHPPVRAEAEKGPDHPQRSTTTSSWKAPGCPSTRW